MPKITEMFAFIAEDSGPDDEGLAAATMGSGMWMPMVGADMARAESLKPCARRIAQLTGKPVKLIRFTQREDLETFEPGGDSHAG